MENPLSSDENSILNRVFGETSSKLEIIPIVGMGGIGKTTFARYVYNHFETCFDIRAWVVISQRYDISEILREILSELSDKKRGDELSRKVENKKMDEDSLIDKVHKTLWRRKYLIVMDDMWYPNAWDDLRHAFPDDCNGSRIIITTRELNVASYVVGSLSHPHKMQLMSIDRSWKLLQERVFGQRSCPPELETIGKRIAVKCGGLPLSIVVMAGVLSKLDQRQGSWEKVADNVSQVVSTSGGQVSDILSLSYMHLPRHLRPCFLYMGCFPEDYEIDVSNLIRLWAGEGFLMDESKDMEELGYEYLEDLAGRSLVLIEKKRHDGRMKAVKIHDLLRDLCLRKCRDDNFLHIVSEFAEGIENSHRLSVYSDAWDRIPTTPIDSILFFWCGESPRNFWNYCDFRFVKVLNSITVIFPRFPGEVSELVHLGYLAFTYESYDRTDKLEIPESLSKLQNLQTIVIRRLWSSPSTAYLPISVWRMPQLRHVILLNGFLPHPCEPLPLVNLHALSRLRNFTCSGRILEMLQTSRSLGSFTRMMARAKRDGRSMD